MPLAFTRTLFCLSQTTGTRDIAKKAEEDVHARYENFKTRFQGEEDVERDRKTDKIVAFRPELSIGLFSETQIARTTERGF